MDNQRVKDITVSAFEKILYLIILAIGNALVILGEGCITYANEQGFVFADTPDGSVSAVN